MSFAFISHPQCLLHEMGEAHPERPDRLGAIEDRLLASRLDWLVTRFDAPEATREQLLRVHDAAHLERLAEISPGSGLVEIDPDTLMNPHTLAAARRAARAAGVGTGLVVGGGGGGG